ncbi:MAG: hypothetical protein WCD70_06350 [Alphaproteobacteria bacterium]
MTAKYALPPKMLPRVLGDWKSYPTHDDVVPRIIELYGAGTMRASNQPDVSWEQKLGNPRSFNIIRWINDYGKNAVNEFVLARNRVAGAGGDTRGKKPIAPKAKQPGSSRDMNLGLTPGNGQST